MSSWECASDAERSAQAQPLEAVVTCNVMFEFFINDLLRGVAAVACSVLLCFPFRVCLQLSLVKVPLNQRVVHGSNATPAARTHKIVQMHSATRTEPTRQLDS